MMDVEKDFKVKANSFANWLTSIIISNFVYLINLKVNRELIPLWQKNIYILKLDFGLTAGALVLMALFKGLGVLTSWMRLDWRKEDRGLEECRTWLFVFFCIFGVVAIVLSGLILWRQLFND